jgi:hypothetical protein
MRAHALLGAPAGGALMRVWGVSIGVGQLLELLVRRTFNDDGFGRAIGR